MTSYNFEEQSIMKNIIWQYFLRDKENQVAKCKICEKVLKILGGSTSGLHTHLRSVHKRDVRKRSPDDDDFDDLPICPPKKIKKSTEDEKLNSKQLSDDDDVSEPVDDKTWCSTAEHTGDDPLFEFKDENGKTLPIDVKQYQKPEDEFDLVGRTIAYKLRKMTGLQCAIAEKLISDVTFLGSFGKLSMSTIIYSPDDTSSSYTNNEIKVSNIKQQIQ